MKMDPSAIIEIDHDEDDHAEAGRSWWGLAIPGEGHKEAHESVIGTCFVEVLNVQIRST